MQCYTLTHLADSALLRDLAALVARDRATTAVLLAHLAEVDARRLYRPAGYPSMFEYCVRELGLSEDAAYKRIQAARAARRFPALYDALAEGRLHLSGAVLLAPHLTPDNAEELLAAAERRSKAEIEGLLARRFPRPDLPSRIVALLGAGQLAPGQVGVSTQVATPGMTHAPGLLSAPEALTVSDLQAVPEAFTAANQLAPGQVGVSTQVATPGMTHAPDLGQVGVSTGGPPGPASGAVARNWPGAIGRTRPLAPARFALQVTLDQETHDMLQQARMLLSHQVPSGDLAEVLHRVLKAALPALERRKFAATDRPRARRDSSDARPVPEKSHRTPGRSRPVRAESTGECGGAKLALPRDPALDGTPGVAAHGRRAGGRRTVPSHVKRAVWERDGGRCTFVSERGRRCPARRLLEFDHVRPVARGGQASVEGIRLRCRAHNQYEAERAFGEAFMRGRREAARRDRALDAASREVVACLRALGCTAEEARRAALDVEGPGGRLIEDTASVPRSAEDTVSVPRSLEERVRLALTRLGSRPRVHTPVGRSEPRSGVSVSC